MLLGIRIEICPVDPRFRGVLHAVELDRVAVSARLVRAVAQVLEELLGRERLVVEREVGARLALNRVADDGIPLSGLHSGAVQRSDLRGQ